MESDKVFIKKWDDENNMRIFCVKGNISLIKIDLKKDSPYEKEMDELSKIFSNQRLSLVTAELLKVKGFTEQNQS